MTYFEAIVLGTVQGLTEFLPISSSGHLVLVQNFLKIDNPGNEIEILVHIGTLASILTVFFDDIKSLLINIKTKNNQFFILLLIIATIPSIIIGLGFKDLFESFFDNLEVVKVAFILTGIILFSSKYFRLRNKSFTILSSIIIGLAQAFAITPGISRSGITISCALLFGINPKQAARFSFLMAIPVILGAGLLTAIDLNGSFSISFSIGVVALFSSYIVGLLALNWLIKWLSQGKFYIFGFYCLSLGCILLFD